MTRLGRAIDGPTVLYRGIWPTYFAAPFGIAAVAARLLELERARKPRMRWRWRSPSRRPASGITTPPPPRAGSPSATPPATGSPRRWRRKQAFTSDLELVDGNFLSGVYGVTPDVAALTDGLGERDALAEVSFKPWCAARQTMAATQALKEIIESGVTPAAMSKIEVAVLPPHLKMIDHGVKSGDRASHLTSLQYCMAVAALAPGMALDCRPIAAGPAAAVRDFMEQDQGRGGRGPARRLSAHLAGARERHGRLGAPRAAGDACSRRSRAAVRSRAGASENFLRFATPVLGRSNDADACSLLADKRFEAGKFEPLLEEIEPRHFGRNASV